ncbi:hypothetical protein EKL29_12155 [Pantoea sp. YU22]|nr:hypothetical protein EKL29_12155 [Pantoea sp. YU22]
MRCVLGASPDKPESTTLLTLLPVFFSQPGAGFFLSRFPVSSFSSAHHPLCACSLFLNRGVKFFSYQ